MRSIILSQERPVNSEKPTANAASSASVAPLKPIADMSDAPIRSPIAPPGAPGSWIGSRHKRIASIADDASSTIANPMRPEEQRMIGFPLGIGDPAIAVDDEHDAGNDQPPRGCAEQIEQQVSKPRTDDAAAIAERFGRRRRTTSRDRCAYNLRG